MDRALTIGGFLLLSAILPKWILFGEVCSEPWFDRFRLVVAPTQQNVWAQRLFRRGRGHVSLAACLDAAARLA